MKKVILTLLFATLMGLYKTFVMQQLWNWFLVPTFHVREVSFFLMYGIFLLIGMTTNHSTPEIDKIDALSVLVQYCIPADRTEEAHEALKEHLEEATRGFVFSAIGGAFLGCTLTLVIGWLIHNFAY